MRVNSRDFLKGFGAGVSMLAAQELLHAGQRSRTKPNVILCMTDDQGWGGMGYNGHPVLRTPNLDQMAKGIRCDRFYSGALSARPLGARPKNSLSLFVHP